MPDTLIQHWKEYESVMYVYIKTIFTITFFHSVYHHNYSLSYVAASKLFTFNDWRLNTP